jgi:MFS family permease
MVTRTAVETERADTIWTREVLVPAGVVVLGAITTILDATVVNVALPTLGRDLHTSISTVQWVPTIYLLAFASVIPLSGWASARFGARRVWIGALALFMIGSLSCGLAPSVGALVACRPARLSGSTGRDGPWCRAASAFSCTGWPRPAGKPIR